MRKTSILRNNVFWFVLLVLGLSLLATQAIMPSWLESSDSTWFALHSRKITVMVVLSFTLLCGLFSFGARKMRARFIMRCLWPFIDSVDEHGETLFEDEVLQSQRQSRLLALTERLSRPCAFQKPCLVWVDFEGGHSSGRWMLANNIDSVEVFQGSGLIAHTVWVETDDAWMIDLSALLIEDGPSSRRDVLLDFIVTLSRLNLLDAVVLPISVDKGAWEIDQIAFEALMRFVDTLSKELNIQIPIVWMVQNANDFSGLLRDNEAIATVWSRPISPRASLTKRVKAINMYFETVYAHQLGGRRQRNARYALQNLENLRRLRASLVQYYTQWCTHLPKADIKNIIFARSESLKATECHQSDWSHGALILETSVAHTVVQSAQLKMGLVLICLALVGSLCVGGAIAWKRDQARKIETSFQLVVDRLNESAHHLNESDIFAAVNALENACSECSLSNVSSASDSIQTLWRSLLNSVMASYVQRSLEVNFANAGLSDQALFGRLLAYYQLSEGFYPDKVQRPLLGGELMVRVWKSDVLAKAWETLTPLGLDARPVSTHTLEAARSQLAHLKPAQRIVWLIGHLVDRDKLDPKLPATLNLIFEVDDVAIDEFYTVSGYQSAFLPLLSRVSQLLEWDNVLMDDSFEGVVANEVETLYLNSFEKHWATLASRLRLKSPATYNEWVLQLNNIANYQDSIIRKIIAFARSQLIAMKLDAKIWDESLINAGTLSQFASQFRASLRRSGNISKNRHALFQWFRQRFTQNKIGDDHLLALEQTAAQFQPEMETWTLSLVKQWRASILNESSRYVNDAFKQILLRHYQELIVERFPFYESDTELSLRDLGDYFSNSGHEKAFFESYIKPFVNVQHEPWSLKEVGSYRLLLSDEALKSFYRAHLIRSSLYEDNSTQITPLVFNLASDLGHKKVLEIGWGKQIIQLTDEDGEYHSLQRSSFDAKSQAFMRITDEDNAQSLSAKGTWAWFRLLNLGHIEPENVRNHLLMTFEPNRKIVKLNVEGRGLDQVMEYKLYERYRLPQSILEEW